MSKTTYWPRSVDQAIARYQQASTPEEKNKIFTAEIYKPLCKLASSIVTNHPMDHMPGTRREVINDLVLHLWDSLDRVNPDGMVYGYLNMVGRNWMIQENNKHYYRKVQIRPLSVKASDGSYEYDIPVEPEEVNLQSSLDGGGAFSKPEISFNGGGAFDHPTHKYKVRWPTSTSANHNLIIAILKELYEHSEDLQEEFLTSGRVFNYLVAMSGLKSTQVTNSLFYIRKNVGTIEQI